MKIAINANMRNSIPIYHQRKGNRHPDYDYSQNGWYFITICTKHKEAYFGEIRNYEMCLNEYGKIANEYWLEIPNHYKNVQIDEYVIMPDHIHGIIVIKNIPVSVGTEHRSVQCIPGCSVHDYPERSVQYEPDNSVCDYHDHSVQTEQMTNNSRTEQTGKMWTEHCSVPTGGHRKYGLLSKTIKSFKEVCVKRIRKKYGDYDFGWQRSFHDSILCDNDDLKYVRKYIRNNPGKW